MDVMEVGLGHSLGIVRAEVTAVLDAVIRADPFALGRVSDLVAGAPRIFLLGAGRSGLALRMTAMRLMHLGLVVYVVGDTTTPAIARDDVLLAASGSGTTVGIVRAAQTAHDVGAHVAAITTDAASPLALLAGTATIVVPAAGKLDRSGSASAQYAGSLFEQAVVLIGDGLFHALWARSGQDADGLWRRHSNLE